MTALKEYAVPPEIATIEQNADDPQAASDWLSMLLKLQRNRTDADKYFEAYTKMIYLEEAKQSQFLTQFNAENIHFEYSGDEFRFKNNVITESIHLTNDHRYQMIFDFLFIFQQRRTLRR